MGVFKKALLVGLAGILLSTPAFAKKKTHLDYASVGAAVGAVLEKEEFKFTVGLDVARRFPLSKKIGLIFQYSVQSAPQDEFLEGIIMKGGLSLSINDIMKNAELYIGPGFWVNNNEAYFSPQAGLRYHFGKKSGFYLSGDTGLLLQKEKSGAFLEFGAGYRWDF